MRRFLQFTLMVAGLALWVMAATGTALAVTDAEPNNHFTQALGPVASGVKTAGSISATGDVDYYYFYVSALGDVTLSANAANPTLHCYRYEGGYLRGIHDLGSASTKQLPAGLYYVMAHGGTGAYDFTVTGASVTTTRPDGVAIPGQFVIAPEILETHFTEAQGPLQSAFTYRAEISATGDVDYYYFYVSALGDVTLSTNPANPTLHCYRYDGADLHSIHDLGSASTKQLPAGLYYVMAHGGTGGYDFTVTGRRVGPDAKGPVTSGKTASGRRGKSVTLRYRISDISPRALSVVLAVKNGKGKVVARIALGSKRTNSWLSVKWVPRVKGTYAYTVSAKDMAGNAQRKASRAVIRVQ
jgi:hypothetical protein